MMNKQDMEKIIKRIEDEWLEQTKSLSKTDYENAFFTIHIYSIEKEDSDELTFTGDTKFDLLEGGFFFYETDIDQFFPYSAITHVWIDKTW